MLNQWFRSAKTNSMGLSVRSTRKSYRVLIFAWIKLQRSIWHYCVQRASLKRRSLKIRPRQLKRYCPSKNPFSIWSRTASHNIPRFKRKNRSKQRRSKNCKWVLAKRRFQTKRSWKIIYTTLPPTWKPLLADSMKYLMRSKKWGPIYRQLLRANRKLWAYQKLKKS